MHIPKDDLDIVLDAALGWASEQDRAGEPETRIRDAVERIKTSTRRKHQLETMLREFATPSVFAAFSAPWSYLAVRAAAGGWSVTVNECGDIDAKFSGGDIAEFEAVIAKIKAAFVDVTQS